MKSRNKRVEETREQSLTRKEALAKAGKYALFTAAGSMLLLSPKKAVAASDKPTDPGWSQNKNQEKYKEPASGKSPSNQEPAKSKTDVG